MGSPEMSSRWLAGVHEKGWGEARSIPLGAGRRGEGVGGVVDDGGDAYPPGLLAGGDVCEMVAAAISTGGRSKGFLCSRRPSTGTARRGRSDGDDGADRGKSHLRGFTRAHRRH